MYGEGFGVRQRPTTDPFVAPVQCSPQSGIGWLYSQRWHVAVWQFSFFAVEFVRHLGVGRVPAQEDRGRVQFWGNQHHRAGDDDPDNLIFVA